MPLLSPLEIDPTDDSDKGLSNMSSFFSCDLMTSAKKHLEFLKSVREYYVTSNDPKCNQRTHESLRRYQELWLPLVATVATKANADTALASTPTTTTITEQLLYPPPDIAWLWHCHRLAPKHYANYCHENYGGHIIEAQPPFVMVHPSVFTSNMEQSSQLEHPKCDRYFQRTIDLWKEMYPYESFFLDVDKETKVESPPLSLLNGFDLLGSTERQADFLWQVSGERFGDDDFLREGVLNYYRFLQLKQNASKQGTMLVPTYQIDLMWHTHILSSIEMYNEDCNRIVNSKLHHDDSLTDREEGGILDVSFMATKSLWIKQYGTEYIIPGGMYRGEPPPEYYTLQWRSYADALPSMVTNMALVGNVGALSTVEAATVPTQWAPLHGTASNGSPAFTKSDDQTKYGNRDLKYKEDYVFGRYGHNTGYYHIETRAANEILKTRVGEQLNRIEDAIAFEQSCCGFAQSLQDLERKRDTLKQCLKLLRERLAEPIPAGPTKTKHIGSSSVTNNNDDWLYPLILYSSAGGACGGIVCNDASDSGTSCFKFHIQSTIFESVLTL